MKKISKYIKDVEYGKCYHSGINIVKYIIKLSSQEFKNFFKKLQYANIICQMSLLVYSCWNIIDFNSNKSALFLRLYIISQAIFYSYWFNYIIKIIRALNLKANCLHHINFMLKLKNNDINYLFDDNNEKGKVC